MRAAAALLAAGGSLAAPAGDLVTTIPDYKLPRSFKLYSGYINVTGPVNGYDSLHIHYQFHESQSNPVADPLVTWHQGGPGGESIEVGAYTEMGYLHVNSSDRYTNPYSWNRIANMLYLDSPAGVGGSYCTKGGEIQSRCSWNDTTQAEAYAKTLEAFLVAFPEYKSNDLYLTGESYAGQYVPNIANYIANDAGSTLNLKGFAVGNACWGGTETRVQCNGPNSERNDVDLFYGKALVSKKLRDAIYDACGYTRSRVGQDPAKAESESCQQLTREMDSAVGPHNVYNIYDNCPQGDEWLRRNNKTQGWLRRHLRKQMDEGVEPEGELGGGYDWSCGGPYVADSYMDRDDVRAALHLRADKPSKFSYRSSGPASITLYPSLVKKYRIMIYNGDADACVPYPGNEEWTTGLAAAGDITETDAWHPWYTGGTKNVPAGYATNYKVAATGGKFAFVTIRLAGHMVPTFQPAAAFTLFSNYINNVDF